MGTIITTYQTIIFAYCVSRVYDNEFAKELTAETFFRFINHVEKTKKIFPENEVKPYLFQIAKNVIADHYRKDNRHQSYLSQLKEQKNENLEKRILDSLLLEKIKKSILDKEIKLTPTEEIIFKAIFIKHINPSSNAEIQKFTGLEIERLVNSKKTLFRKIRKNFEGHR